MIKFINKFMPFFKTVWSFLAVGGFVSVIDWAFYYVLFNKLNINYVVATIISFITCTLLSLFLTRSFVFHVGNKVSSKETASIFFVNVIALLLTTCLMYILGEITNLDKMLLRILVTGIVLFYNFSVRYFIIYKKSKGGIYSGKE